MALNDSDLEAMRAMVTAAVQAMGKSLDDFNRKAKEASGSDSGLKKLTEITGHLAKGLVGPVGLAAGFYEVAKSLEEFSEHEVRLAGFAKDTGFATQNVEAMQQAMQRMGLSVNEASNVMATLGGKLSNLRAFKESSDLFQTLSRAEGGAAFAYNLLRLEQAGDRMGSINLILKTFSRQTVEGQIALSGYLGVGRSVLTDLSDAMARGIPIWQTSEAEAKKYHDMWVDLSVEYKNIFNSISDHGVEAFTKLAKEWSGNDLDKGAHSVAGIMNAGIDGVVENIRIAIKQVQELKAIWAGGDESHEAALNLLGRQPFGKHFDFLNMTPSEFFKKHPLDFTSPAHADTLSGGDQGFANAVKGMRDRTGEAAIPFGSSDLAGKVTEGNVTLGDIRDILKRMEDRQTGTHGGGAGGPNLGLGTDYSSSFGSGTGVNAGRPGGGHIRLPSDPGGAGHNPGNFKFEQKTEGATHGAGPRASSPSAVLPGSSDFLRQERSSFTQQLSDPSVRRDVAAMAVTEGARDPVPVIESLANRLGYVNAERAKKGLAPVTIEQMLHSGFYGPINRGQLPSAINQLNRNPALANRMEEAIQSVSAGSNLTQGFTDQGLPTDPNGFRFPRISRGGNVFNDWNGGGRLSAGDFRNAAAYRERLMAGVAAEQEAKNTRHTAATMSLMGSDSGRSFDTWRNMNKSDTFSLIDDRNRIDKVQTGTGSVGGKVSAAIEFLNVPKNVRTTGEAEGNIFKELQINRTRQAGVYRSGDQAYE